MDEMAAMLSEYAGGLQQSFSTVFDRVGQSLAQSAQMMQMMNDVMEAALLQNLRVECRFDAATAELLVSIANRSQILLSDVTLAVYLDSTEPVAATIPPLPPAAAAVDTTPNAQAPAMTTAAFAQVFASFSPGEQHVVRMPLQRVPVAGTAELTLRSPGTQAPLLKRCPFRVSLFESVAFHVVERADVATHSLTAAQSAPVDLQKLRSVLRLSPLDAMVTVDVGSYRFAVAETGAAASSSYYLSISRGTSTAAAAEVTIAAAASRATAAAATDTSSATAPPDHEAAKRACEALVAELEASALP